MFQKLRKITAEWFVSPEIKKKSETMISTELIKRIQTIQVKTNHLVNTVMMGEYISAFKGHGMEFNDVREYIPGDDIRLIDWNVMARMGYPFVKGFQEERELTIMLIVDVSSSGEFGSVNRLKHEVAAETASILAFSAIKNNDKVGLILFSDQIEHVIPPKKGKGHIWNVIRSILSFIPEGRKTDFNPPLEYLLHAQKRKTVTFLISDFQVINHEKILNHANQKHDLISIVISDPRENELPADSGLIHLEDAETGESVLVDTHDEELRNRFLKIKKEERNRLKQFLAANSIDKIEISVDRPLTEPIARFFKMRDKRY
tara:strand:+ start:279 stop:1229 length:951 start_codon:yes stop_codon:yes gene_type:complete